MKNRGISIIELLVATSILSVVGICVSRFFSMPVALSRNIMNANEQVSIARATDFMINDIREADPSSIVWETIQSTGTNWTALSFNKVHYDLATPDTPSTTRVDYDFVPGGTATAGSLTRTETPPGTMQTLVANLDAPNAANHIFVQDSANYHVILVTLLYHPSGQPLTVLIRRVAFRG